jgi:hypothetical protein
MWRLVAFVRTDVSEKCVASVIMVQRISKLRTTLVVINDNPSSLIRSNVMIKVTSFSETSVLTKSTRHHNPEDGILPANFYL